MSHTLIVTSPAAQMRYETAGDWLSDNPRAQMIVVVAMPDWRHEFLVALHEMIEAALCNHRGIKEADVTAFDKDFAGAEPGAAPLAPYYREHQFASVVERLAAKELDVDWDAYDAAIEAALNPGG